MKRINNVVSAAARTTDNVNRVNDKPVKTTLEFEPKDVGAARQGKSREYPSSIKITENAAEKALLEKFGFKTTDSADIARVKQLLSTEGSPFAALKTTGDFTADYNNRTGKYELTDNVDKDLYRQLKGKAAEVKTQIEREKQTALPNQTNPNDAIAVKNGIANNQRAELENKLNNQPSISAPNQNESEKSVKTITGAIESVTGTSNPFAATEIGKQLNRLSVSSLRLAGKAMELSNYFSEKLNDAARYVAPDSVDELLNQADKMNRENAQALQDASSAVTNEDTFIDAKAKQAGVEIPLTEDLANKIMYFPEAIPNAIDSAVKGDFKDDDGTYSDKVGKIIGGLNPVSDARDIVADSKRVWDGEKGGWIKLGATVIGAVPIVGDAGKALIKTEEKAIIKGLEKSAEKEIAEETVEKIIKEEVPQIVKKEENFIGTLRGEKVILSDVPTQSVQYTKRSTAGLKELRQAFNKVRADFLKDLPNNAQKLEVLKKAGFTDVDITKLQKGEVPNGWQVHHKLPLDDGGTNAFENLVLIKNEPYHKTITNAQRALVGDLKEGQTRIVDFPIPKGSIYPSKP